MIADHFTSIDLDSVEATSALQTRLERKYVMDVSTLQAGLERLTDTHRVLEIDGRREFSYRTVYYDTPDLRSLREHRQGRRRRYKFRRRHYLDTNRAVLEVKLKAAFGQTVKHGLACGADDHLTDDERTFLALRVFEAYGRCVESSKLRPVLEATARRLTFASPELGERLTCDLFVGLGPSRLKPGFAIVESKSRAGDAVADRVLRKLGARPVACSKYCLGLALSRPELGQGRYRRVLSHFS